MSDAPSDARYGGASISGVLRERLRTGSNRRWLVAHARSKTPQGDASAPLCRWPLAGSRSAEVRNVEVELQRADLWFGCREWDQRRARIPAVGRHVRRHVERALQGPAVEGHRQALTDQRVGVVDQPEVQMGSGR